jgi:quaternary ammonium compound-resistance protein SugE
MTARQKAPPVSDFWYDSTNWYDRTRIGVGGRGWLLARGSIVAWLYLVVAGLLEIGFALSLKASDGFSRLVPTVLFVIFAIASLGLLNVALKDLPVGTAYAVWTGIGAAGTALVGMLVLGDPATVARLGFIGAIVVGVIGLQVTGGGH